MVSQKINSICNCVGTIHLPMYFTGILTPSSSSVFWEIGSSSSNGYQMSSSVQLKSGKHFIVNRIITSSDELQKENNTYSDVQHIQG